MIEGIQEIWDRLSGFTLDEPASVRPFSHRLARENDWSQGYADRVIEEYKKFLLLATTSSRPVTPSKAVDQAWHLHLTYSRSYWETLCPDILQKPLHHDPATGNEDETEKFAAQYRDTLKRYEDTFGEPPPEDIWGNPNDRCPAIAREGKAHGIQKLWGSPGRKRWAKILIAVLFCGLPISVVLADTSEEPSETTQTLLASFHANFGWLFSADGVQSLLILGTALVVGIVFLMLRLSLPASSRTRRNSHGTCGGRAGGASCGSSCGSGGCGGGD